MQNSETAERFGIQLEYEDTWGKFHAASSETIRLILEAAGTPPDSAPAIDPTIVIREGTAAIPLRVPKDRAGAFIRAVVHFEDGGEHEYHAALLEEGLPLPAELRLGYHRISIYWGEEQNAFAEANLIVCPKRARPFDRRAAGVAISLYGVRSARNWGCGDVTDLFSVIDAFARAGAAFVALNPLHAIPNRMPYNTSPYLPQSSLYRNFIYLDVEKVPGYAHEAWVDPEIARLRDAEFVEYEQIARVKLAALGSAFERFLASGGSPELDAYADAEGSALHRFAVYCALDEEMHRRDQNVWLWKDWPEKYHHPDSPAVEDFARENHIRVLFYKFLQWQLDVQFVRAQKHALDAGMRIGLYHDLALATDTFGCDLWASREFYVHGCRVGAPPDEFAPNGQDWGFPPPDREKHRADGYQRFAQSIRHSARHGGALRIDHVMRLFRLYWIPDSLTAKEGAYVRDFADDLLGVLSLESVRHGFVVVGEDLGTVSEEIRAKLTESGILGYRLLWFEREMDGAFHLPEEYSPQAAVSTSTHDLPTLAGFFTGRDIEARHDAKLIDDADYQKQWASRRKDIKSLNDVLEEAGFKDDALSFLLSTPCTLAIVNQEDLTGETDQQNLPASTWQYPNWRHKMKVAVEDLEQLVPDLRAKIQNSGR
jgi:4-alpha-glucanotransferase